jgi:hypothetical protein
MKQFGFQDAVRPLRNQSSISFRIQKGGTETPALHGNFPWMPCAARRHSSRVRKRSPRARRTLDPAEYSRPFPRRCRVWFAHNVSTTAAFGELLCLHNVRCDDICQYCANSASFACTRAQLRDAGTASPRVARCHGLSCGCLGCEFRHILSGLVPARRKESKQRIAHREGSHGVLRLNNDCTANTFSGGCSCKFSILSSPIFRGHSLHNHGLWITIGPTFIVYVPFDLQTCLIRISSRCDFVILDVVRCFLD